MAGSLVYFCSGVLTVFERSHIPLNKWILAAHFMCSSKKGISSHQLHRMLGVTYKTAWFMTHRLREAMRELDPDPLGGPGKPVEADETYWSSEKTTFVSGKGWTKTRGTKDSMKIVTLVERKGQARSFHVPEVNAETLKPILTEQIHPKSILNTDEARVYKPIGRKFAGHETVNHSIDEYVRGDAGTQVVENYYSILKRGLTGVYQHVSQQHLKRYVCEFDFRYNERQALGVNDNMRRDRALKGINGKRLTYRVTKEQAKASGGRPLDDSESSLIESR